MMLNLCTAMAENSDDKGIKKAITDVKSVIEIPEEYGNFDYSSYENEGESVWNLTWSSEDGKRIRASVSSDGIILSYNDISYEKQNINMANMTHYEALDMAKEFIKKVDFKLYNTLVLENEFNNGISSDFVFSETANGIKLYNRTTYVSIDRVSKKVTSYSSGGVTKKQIVAVANQLGEEAAREAYLKKIGIELLYQIKYDRKDNKLEKSTEPVYALKNKGNVAIDVESGEEITFKSSEGYRAINGAATDSSKAELEAAGGAFTPEEIKAIENVSGLIDKADAEKIVKDAFFEEGKFYLDATSYRLSKEYEKENYFWNLGFNSPEGEEYKYANANLNAKSGELLSYYSSYDGEQIAEATVASEDVTAKVKAFLEKYAPSRIVECGELEANVSKYGVDFKADRVKNGVRVEGEYISIGAAHDGVIKNYQMSIDESLEFADISSVIGQSEAMKALATYGKFEKCYVYNGENYVLAYVFKEPYVKINPFTGESLAKNEESGVAVKQYDDISGHWAEDIIKALADNGYFIDNPSFNPDKAITIKEFLTFAKFVYNATDEALCAKIEIVEPEKKELDLKIDVNGVITREIAAKYITYDMGFYEIAKYGQIFKYPFKDSHLVNQDTVGHIAICAAKKVFSGDMEGNFNPLKEMTRAEAATVIYNYYRNN